MPLAASPSVEFISGNAKQTNKHRPDTWIQVVATDVNLEMLQMAKTKHKAEVGDAGPVVEIMTSDAEALAFPDSSFDVVVDTFGKQRTPCVLSV